MECGIASASSQFNALQQTLIEHESEDNELSSKQDESLESGIQNSSTNLTTSLNAHAQTLSEKNVEISKTCESIFLVAVSHLQMVKDNFWYIHKPNLDIVLQTFFYFYAVMFNHVFVIIQIRDGEAYFPKCQEVSHCSWRYHPLL